MNRELQIIIFRYACKRQAVADRIVLNEERNGHDYRVAEHLPKVQEILEELRILEILFDSYNGGLEPLDPNLPWSLS